LNGWQRYQNNQQLPKTLNRLNLDYALKIETSNLCLLFRHQDRETAENNFGTFNEINCGIAILLNHFT
jgi:hypothetical protein